MYDHVLFAIGKVKGNVRSMKKIIAKKLLDDVLLVACADNEFIKTIVAVQLHNVPQDGHAAQLHHGLGLKLAFFGDSGAVSTGENQGFHVVSPLNQYKEIEMLLPAKNR